MTVDEILKGLESGSKMKELASNLNKSVSWVQRKLKSLGYEFDNSEKVWVYKREGNEPLDYDLLTDVKTDSPTIHEEVKYSSQPIHIDVKSISSTVHTDVKDVSPTVHTNKKRSSQAIHTQFTDGEISIIKQYIKRRTTGDLDVKLSIYERTFDLPETEEKERRTVLVYKSLGKKLDALAESCKIEKTDIWNMAIQDFLEKYQ
ncbi:ribbon-helix-helix domain-containing protein [Brevibacillus daliensis]|uniref:ribbon-helix-helix domain-containing protein n=1 Tax=Brevibacillus daliensis TaxID=2892995 RepID=UPI001E325C2B|nr:ribbon-helix-helix domain-containing protein [Brevibacillus daliensis]